MSATVKDKRANRKLKIDFHYFKSIKPIFNNFFDSQNIGCLWSVYVLHQRIGGGEGVLRQNADTADDLEPKD